MKHRKILKIKDQKQPQATFVLEYQDDGLDWAIDKGLINNPLLNHKPSEQVEPIIMMLIFHYAKTKSTKAISLDLNISLKCISTNFKKAAVAADHLQIVNNQVCYRPINKRLHIEDPVYLVTYQNWLNAKINNKAKERKRKQHRFDWQWKQFDQIIDQNYDQLAIDLGQEHPSVQQILDALIDQDQLKGIKIPHLSTIYRWIVAKKHNWSPNDYAFGAYNKPKAIDHNYHKHFSGNFQLYRDYLKIDDPLKKLKTWELDTMHGKRSDQTWVGVLVNRATRMVYPFISEKNPAAFYQAFRQLLIDEGIEIDYLIIDNGQENSQLDQIAQVKAIYRHQPRTPQQKAIVERTIRILRAYRGFGKGQSFDLLTKSDCLKLTKLMQKRKFYYGHLGQRMSPIQCQQWYG